MRGVRPGGDVGRRHGPQEGDLLAQSKCFRHLTAIAAIVAHDHGIVTVQERRGEVHAAEHGARGGGANLSPSGAKVRSLHAEGSRARPYFLAAYGVSNHASLAAWTACLIAGSGVPLNGNVRVCTDLPCRNVCQPLHPACSGARPARGFDPPIGACEDEGSAEMGQATGIGGRALSAGFGVSSDRMKMTTNATKITRAVKARTPYATGVVVNMPPVSATLNFRGSLQP